MFASKRLIKIKPKKKWDNLNMMLFSSPEHVVRASVRPSVNNFFKQHLL